MDDFERLAERFRIPLAPEPEHFSKRCPGCNQPFFARSFEQKYCGKRCRAKFKGNPQKASKAKFNYAVYIQSEDWKRKADAAKKKAGYKCQVCNRGTSEVLQLEAHHRTYENLGNELASDITVLCNECHDLFSNKMMKP